MENLADISEPQVLPDEQNEQQIQFSICLFSFNGSKAKQFLPLKLSKQMENLNSLISLLIWQNLKVL